MEARKTVTPSWTPARRIGQDAFIPETEIETSIFLSKDRKKIRIVDNIGNRISIPASCSNKNNPLVIRSMHVHARRLPPFPCGCYFDWIDGVYELIRRQGCTLPH